MKHIILILPFLCVSILLSASTAMAAEPAPHAQTPREVRQRLKETLQNAPAAQPQSPALDPYSDIPDEFITEARAFYQQCSTTAHLSQYYDCKCLATKFLDKRIEKGDEPTKGQIARLVQGECLDASGAAGYEYQRCLAQPSLVPSNGIPPEDYCACVGSTYARLYEGGGMRVSSSTFINLKSQAYVMCQNPELRSQLYPGKPQN
jgi:hypothetical protein